MKLKYQARYIKGERKELPAVLDVRAMNIIAAGKAWSKQLGKQGYHALYSAQADGLPWGQYLLVCNRGTAAVYSIEGNQ